MYVETVTYTDYNGLERTEDFLFNLTEAELVEMNFEEHGRLEEKFDKIIKAKNVRVIMEVFKDLLLKAYGEKSEDGRRFVKSPEISKAFSETPAYSILYMKYAVDDAAAAAFVKGVLPKVADVELKKAEAAKELTSSESSMAEMFDLKQ